MKRFGLVALTTLCLLASPAAWAEEVVEHAQGAEAAAEAAPAHGAPAPQAEQGQVHEAAPVHQAQAVHAEPAQGHEAVAEHGEAHGNAHGGGHAAGRAEQSELSCEQILSMHEAEEENPAVADVILHHVSDTYNFEFESPFSHTKVGTNLKQVQCKMFGWNGVVHLGTLAVDLTPTKHTVWMWIAALILIAMFWGAAPKKGQIVPSGVGTLLEIMVVFVRDEIARKNIPGKDAERYTPYLLNVFFFILVINFLGLVPYAAAATSNVSVTMALALFTFVFTQIAGIRAAGFGGYLKHLTGGVHPALWPIMIPVEVLGLFTKPFALTMRLFANMVAGHIVIFFLLGLIFIMKTMALAPVSVAFAFGIYLLEIFVALVQAYVFTMLSSLFIGMGSAMAHHDHGGDHGAQGHGEPQAHH